MRQLRFEVNFLLEKTRFFERGDETTQGICWPLEFNPQISATRAALVASACEVSS
jgi:hypothetical protein